MTDKAALEATIRDAIMEYCGERMDEPFDPSNPIIRLHEPTFGGEEIWAALAVLLSTRVTMGPQVRKFEEMYAEKYGYKDAVMVNSGSSANLLAVAAVVNPRYPNQLKPGDEVIVPALSWSTTVWPLVQFGLVPVFCDHDPKTLNIDPNEIEAAIGPKTRAIKLVHVYGNPCDMDAIMAIADKHNLVVIEDSCESMGATYKGKAVGGMGQVGTFSTYFSHHITTLEGGFCVTNDPEFAELMRVLRAHGWVREVKDRQKYLDKYPHIDPKFLFVNSGFNLRATEVQAAMGQIQLPKIDAFIDARTETAMYYKSELVPYLNQFTVQDQQADAVSSWFGLPMTIRLGADFTKADICSHLNADGIETRPLIAGNMAEQPAMELFEHRVQGDLANAKHAMAAGFTWGNHQSIGPDARAHVISSFKRFMESRG